MRHCKSLTAVKKQKRREHETYLEKNLVKRIAIGLFLPISAMGADQDLQQKVDDLEKKVNKPNKSPLANG